MRVQRRLVLWPVALAIMGSIAGCSTSTSGRGALVGSFIQVGGPGLIVNGRPEQPKPVPLPGQIVARSETGNTFTVTVGKSGRFRMLLPPGTYRFTGYSPMYGGPCAGEGAIKVRVGKHIAHVNVICVAA